MVCPLHVGLWRFFFIILYRIAWWSSAGKELTPWLSACAVLLHAVLICFVPFPYVYGEGSGIRLYRFLIIAFSSTLDFKICEVDVRYSAYCPACCFCVSVTLYSWQNQQNGMCAQRRLRSAWARPVWSESSLSTWRKFGSLATHWAHSEDKMIRLGGCPCWSESSLDAHAFCWFCHEAAHFALKSFRALCPRVSSFLLALWSRRLGKRELVCVLLVHLFVCLFVLYVLVYVLFLFPLVSGVDCGL